MNEDMDMLYGFYASDQDDAERQARKIVKEQAYERIELKAYPYGLVMHHSRIAGTYGRGEDVAVQIIPNSKGAADVSNHYVIIQYSDMHL